MKKSKYKTTPKRPAAAKRSKESFSIRKKRSIFQLSSDYAVFGVVMLLLSSIFWAYLGAKLQASNADQIANSYLFENTRTFHQAQLPAAHSFLIKWPIFLLIRLLGLTAAAFVWVTVFLTVATVAGVAWVLHRIDSRPAVFGTLCLCLASALLLVPAAPYAGGILPVNMAMLATRNIEYLLYIGSLVLLTRAPRLKSWNFLLGTFGLAVLGASDKLFLTLSLGGAVLALVSYFIVRRWALAMLAARWLAASLVAAAAATGLLWAVNASGLTHIAGAAGNSPYALIHSLRSFGLGVVFGGLGILTNFGANPAFDIALLRNFPSTVQHRLLGSGGMSFLTNILIFCLGIALSLKLYFSTFHRGKKPGQKTDKPTKLAAMLIYSSLAAIGAFIATDHYYVVDARYLTLVMITVFVCAAAYLRKSKFKSQRWPAAAGIIATISILSGIYSSYTTYLGQNAALSDISRRNSLVALAVKNHPVDVLVGDYWRTLPIKAIQPKTNIMPLQDCTQERDILSSKNWQKDLKTHSFAYLLSFDKSLTNYPACSLDQILAAYGRPNSTVLISGSLDKPAELVLFYDQGERKGSNQGSTQTVLPVAPQQIPQADCPYTLMNIVAHQDDDLLFLSPDLTHDIQAQHCVRTIYVTAGDSGFDQLYWVARERGSEAAYSKLLGSSAPWVQRTIKMSDNQYITLVNPKGNPNISLIFMRLADGSPIGEGFKASHSESLERLETDKIKAIGSVDKQSGYSSDQLVDVLAKLMEIYQPTEIRTQAPSNENPQFPDHSDHMAVGRYAAKAYKKYDNSSILPLKYYYGYPIKKMPPNVEGADLDVKTAAFLAYSQFDPATCHSKVECAEAGNYGFYLQRQYQATIP